MNDPRTRIHCTVGPACTDGHVLEAMIEAGADVFRVNGAHADEAQIAAWIGRVRAASKATGRFSGVLVDLPGPKFRVGRLAGGEPIALRPGDVIRFDGTDTPGDERRVPLRHMPYFADITPGATLALGDGKRRLEVVSADEGSLDARAYDEVEVSQGLGVHFPGLSLPTAVPTRHDRQLLAAAMRAGADMISQSFVRTPEDVARLRHLLRESGAGHTRLVAKIERADAVKSIDAIAADADALLLGRGDLGIDAGVENVPSLQRRVLEAGRRAGVPVVIATEMLDSMIRDARPTRAEASDVAGAVFEGADGVMLSGETAIGAHPVLVVDTMADILRAAEADPSAPYAGTRAFDALPTLPGRPDQHGVKAAVGLAAQTRAEAIVVFTRQGSSAVRISKERPRARVHAFAPSAEVCRHLTIAWGIRATMLPASRDTDEILEYVRERVAAGLESGDRVVVVMGSAQDPAGATTLIKLLTI